jgi:antitoxin ParD1/3/4
MNVSLTPELENFIQQKVDSKMYQTASEVVREALRLFVAHEQEQQAKLDALRRDIQVGLDQLERGEYIEGKDLTVERIREGAIKRFGDPSKRKRS